MKKLYISLIALLLCLNVFSQEDYSRVKILGTDAELRLVGDLGLPLDHGEHKKDMWFISDFSESDIAKLENGGFRYEILIKDVKAYYVAQNQNPSTKGYKNAACPTIGGNTYTPVTPTNFQLGTMGGYYKYQEFLDEIDSMASKYPNLISSKAPIDTYTTIDGNPIYWMRLSDNPNTDENEDEVLYTAIHHAREPASLSTTIYYMWYLLENYGVIDEVTYLVDNTEMYFVPMVNPDGYQYNELTDPNGGGMHRKNRRDVGSFNKGVDLNRNYGYFWNMSGTSSNMNNDTYAGTGAFSEVESQAMRWFCENRDFEFAYNAHSHGDLLLYPIGWSTSEVAPDAPYFAAFTNHLVEKNGYVNEKSSSLYPAAGDSDDWMYIDDLVTKPTIFAMTPEISSEGVANNFWPPANLIEEICRENVWMYLKLSQMPKIYGITTDLENSKVIAVTDYFNYEIERLGLTDGDITVSIIPITGIQTMGGPNTHLLNLMDIVEDSIAYTLNAGLGFGDDIIYVIETNNGTWVSKDTVYKTFGAGTQMFFDNGDNLDNWTGTWNFTNEDFWSALNCITDSPFVNYSNNANSDCVLIPVFTLENATYAYATFYAKWEIENNWDYVQFMISTNGGISWTPLCGKYTNKGGSNQDFDNPLYDSFQSNWIQEEIDLSGYLGETLVKFKFRMISDGGVTEDGFYFDDFSIFTDGEETIDISGVEELTENDIQLYPNPTSNLLNIQLDNPYQIDKIEITNELGQVVKTLIPLAGKLSVSTEDLAEGIYFLNVYSSVSNRIVKRFTVVR